MNANRNKPSLINKRINIDSLCDRLKQEEYKQTLSEKMHQIHDDNQTNETEKTETKLQEMWNKIGEITLTTA